MGKRYKGRLKDYENSQLDKTHPGPSQIEVVERPGLPNNEAVAP
jgi:hypothetical protein